MRKDQRIGKRAFYLGFLPQCVYGTIQAITWEGKTEYWKVLSNQGMTLEGPATSFCLYEWEEVYPSDRIKYRTDEGGYWEVAVVRPHLSIDQLCFIIKVMGTQHSRAKANVGYEFAAHPARFTKI
jgi:hypothetical protein